MIQQDFGWALQQLAQGLKIQRAGWNGKGMWVYKVWGSSATVEHYSVNLQPFLVMKTAQDTWIPWAPSQSDILATDWEVLEKV